MSLTTRCPACGTRFHVVPDQLRISDGWVRCGSCREVFDARHSLQPPPPVQHAAAPYTSPPPSLTPQTSASPSLDGSSPAQHLPFLTHRLPTPTQPPSPTDAAHTHAHSTTDDDPGGDPDGDETTPAAHTLPPFPLPELPSLELEPPPPAPTPELPTLELPTLELPSLDLPPLPPATTDTPLATPAPETPPSPEPGHAVPPPAPGPDEDADMATDTDAQAGADIDMGVHNPGPQTLQPPGQPTAIELDFDLSRPASQPTDLAPADTTPALPPVQPPITPPNAKTEAAVPPIPSDTHTVPAAETEPAAAPNVAPNVTPDTATEAATEPPPNAPPPATPLQTASPDTTAALQESPAALPGFMLQARRKAWWNQPWIRFVMGMLVMLLPFFLVLQILFHERHTIAAWRPQWRPALEVMCVTLACEMRHHRDIDAVVVTGSSFAESDQPGRYQLDLSIRNQSGALLATPAVELTLTDAQEQTLVRKIIPPTHLGAPPELAAHTEWSGTLTLTTTGLPSPVTGYTVLLFYP